MRRNEPSTKSRSRFFKKKIMWKLYHNWNENKDFRKLEGSFCFINFVTLEMGRYLKDWWKWVSCNGVGRILTESGVNNKAKVFTRLVAIFVWVVVKLSGADECVFWTTNDQTRADIYRSMDVKLLDVQLIIVGSRPFDWLLSDPLQRFSSLISASSDDSRLIVNSKVLSIIPCHFSNLYPLLKFYFLDKFFTLRAQHPCIDLLQFSGFLYLFNYF